MGIDVEILQSELELNDALNSLISHQADLDWPADILIVMADLPLLREKEIRGILSCQGDVVLCPGRGGGTNMILIRSPKFRTCYHGLSFPEHMAYARKACLNFSDGEAKKALEMMGFSLSESGRSIIERHYQKAI